MAKQSKSNVPTNEPFDTTPDSTDAEPLETAQLPDADVQGDEAPKEGEDPTMAAGMTSAAEFGSNGTETSAASFSDENLPTLPSEGTDAPLGDLGQGACPASDKTDAPADATAQDTEGSEGGDKAAEAYIGGALDEKGEPAEPMQIPVDPVTGRPLDKAQMPGGQPLIFGGGQAPAAVAPAGQVPADKVKDSGADET